MKNLFLTAAFLLFAFGANAQKSLTVENQYPGDAKAQKEYSIALEKQSSEKSAIRTTWLSSRPGSDWFISLQAGMGGILSDKNVGIEKPWDWFSNGHQGFWHPTAGLSVGKWFSPVWGLRVNGTYGHTQAYNKNELPLNSVKYVAGTVDYLINLKNVFRPYNPKGLFNPVLYFGVGGINQLKGDYNKANWYMTEKAGLQLNFRLCDAWDIFLDGHAILAPVGFDKNNHSSIANSQVITNGSIGLTYKINFRKFVKAPLYDQNEIDALLQEINDLRNRPTVVCPPVKDCPPAEKTVVVEKAKEATLEPVFFTLGSAIVRDNQLLNVAKAAEYLIDHPDAKLELASYADKKTGSAAVNKALSKKRGEAVANILTGKFGIAKSRLSLKHYGDTVQPFAENDWNRVTLFVK